MLNNILLSFCILLSFFSVFCFFYFDRKGSEDNAVKSIIVGIFSFMLGMPLFTNAYNAYQYSNFETYEDQGYNIIASYGVFSDSQYPNTISCTDEDSVIFLSKDMSKVESIAKARYAACK